MLFRFLLATATIIYTVISANEKNDKLVGRSRILLTDPAGTYESYYEPRYWDRGDRYGDRIDGNKQRSSAEYNNRGDRYWNQPDWNRGYDRTDRSYGNKGTENDQGVRYDDRGNGGYAANNGGGYGKSYDYAQKQWKKDDKSYGDGDNADGQRNNENGDKNNQDRGYGGYASNKGGDKFNRNTDSIYGGFAANKGGNNGNKSGDRYKNNQDKNGNNGNPSGDRYNGNKSGDKYNKNGAGWGQSGRRGYGRVGYASNVGGYDRKQDNYGNDGGDGRNYGYGWDKSRERRQNR